MNGDQRVTENELLRYLDKQLSDAETADLQRRLANDESAQRWLAQLLAQEDQLAHALKRTFVPPEKSVAEIEAWFVDDLKEAAPAVSLGQGSRSRRSMLIAGCAVAAALTGVMLVANWVRPKKVAPFFEPRSLAAIYTETVHNGFQPYYLCDDEERFAQTFAKRQGVRLRLAPLPPKRSMAGLSYLGGSSRDATAMLCFVEDRPVVVFVDQAENQRHAVSDVPAGESLFVHESKLGDLVLWEVSPFAQPMMMQFLLVEELVQPSN
jgi:anti-sigma factor RsiW